MQLYTMLAVAASVSEWQIALRQVLVSPFHGAVCIIAGDLTALKHCLQVAEDIDGKEHIMREYKGKVLLITNVASECGYTESNYKGLQQLYDKYHDRGLEVQPFSGPARFVPQRMLVLDLVMSHAGCISELAWLIPSGSCGLQILAFPCNQFGSQEPGDGVSIKEFAQKR